MKEGGIINYQKGGNKKLAVTALRHWLETEQYIADELRRRGIILEPQKPGTPRLQLMAYRREYTALVDIHLNIDGGDTSGKTLEFMIR